MNYSIPLLSHPWHTYRILQISRTPTSQAQNICIFPSCYLQSYNSKCVICSQVFVGQSKLFVTCITIENIKRNFKICEEVSLFMTFWVKYFPQTEIATKCQDIIGNATTTWISCFNCMNAVLYGITCRNMRLRLHGSCSNTSQRSIACIIHYHMKR